MSSTGRLPVTVIGGYLGAGKTTLVNGLLRQADGRRLAVLVNDFGELSIDADLIRSGSDTVLQLAGGCVCCSIGSDLIGALTSVREVIADPDHVIVEASGVALPATVAATVTLAPGMRRNGVVVMLDASRLDSLLNDRYLADTVQRQIASADLLLQSHADELDPTGTEALQAQVRALNERAPLLDSARGTVPIDLVLEPRLPGAAGWLNPGDGTRTLRAQDTAPSGENGQPLQQHLVDTAGRATHARFESRGFAAGAPIDPQPLQQVLADRTLGIERAKGIFRRPDGQIVVVHAVAGRVDLEIMPSDATPAGLERLVLIGVHDRWQPAAIAAALAAQGWTALAQPE
ncbi:MAG: GTP-binding protein [Burkholderiaceae bacterium]